MKRLHNKSTAARIVIMTTLTVAMTTVWHSGHAITAKPDTALLKHGEALYQQRCAVCHDQPTGRIPSRTSLATQTAEGVVVALEIGSMSAMASGMNRTEIEAVAAYLTGDTPQSWDPPAIVQCERPASPVVISKDDWPTVGRDMTGSRYQTQASIDSTSLPSLKLKWSFAIADGAPGGVVTAGGRIFLATGSGQVLSLDADSGCSHWQFETQRMVRMVTVAPVAEDSNQAAVFFGDDQGYVTALDADNGTRLWKTRVEDHPLVRITAPPSVADGRVYVPISSMEDPRTHDPSYACCTFRGSVVSLDATSGAIHWKSHTIAEPTKPAGHHAGVPRFSPAGASIFTPLSLDTGRNLVYAATAESYTEEDPPGSYSVIAFDMHTGAHVWQRQFLPKADDRERICAEIEYTDCRNLFSMSTQVMLHSLPDGREILLVGQKWGYMYGLDPDDGGALIWKQKIAQGGDLGGVMYGFSADERTAYVSISDIDFAPDPNLRDTALKPGGLVALDIATGDVIWTTAPTEPQCSWGEKSCSSAQVSATTAVPGAIFSGAWDGHMRAFSSENGSLLWQVDTALPRQGVNGAAVKGGRIGGYPVTIGNNHVYIVSGSNTVERPGNALLVYSLEGK